ncbi:hypothetical protein T10_8406 [Trichinella papuae]|uniref:Uncharacterized protein n=1 Tax=Trichinella papuae TaxID=268474 RepID=A0A0V1LYM9_9BILA|nr:hypothetical protein T10_3396 [Trichinella papuae]KRZ64633.1 hypothetical protein T10_8406 [Trichinella papuae]
MQNFHSLGANIATPQAMPQAIFQNFRIFRNFSPRRRPRLRLRA